MKRRSRFALALAGAVLLTPALAAACPACANRDDGSGMKTVTLLGSMILFPFGVAAVVTRAIRRAESDSKPRGGDTP